MDRNKYEVIRLRMEKTAKALRENNMSAYCVDSAQEALELFLSLVPENSTVACGGSVTLDETGILNAIKSPAYRFIDRYEKGLSPEEVEKRHREAFFADVYVTSTNAVTENGELYNVDGRGNRVAAMIYGPKKVIVVTGYNKIVRDAEQAADRVRKIAAPANTRRLSLDTPCRKTGYCMDCKSDSRICASHTLLSFQREKDRICVIIIGEELGY